MSFKFYNCKVRMQDQFCSAYKIADIKTAPTFYRKAVEFCGQYFTKNQRYFE